MEKKICYICNEEKELEHFCKNKKAKQGVTNLCKSCHYTRRKEKYSEKEEETRKKTYQRRKENPEKYALFLNKKKEYRSRRREQYLLLSCKNRAKKQNIPFNIDISDIIIPEYCPLLGIKMIYREGKENFNGPSVDKIIPELGYIKNNVRVISKKANMMKFNASKEELLIFSENIKKYLDE